jgi:hypothetical protein
MEIEDTFDITGRGLAVAIGQTTNLPVGKKLSARVTRPDGSVVQADAYKEWFLRRTPEPLEREAFLLLGLSKADVPIGSSLQIEQSVG